MSLEGSLETIALPDVLALLSVTAKTGELRIEARGTAGSIWFDAGRLAGFDVAGQRTAANALFYLLRQKEGNFNFRTGTTPANSVPPQDVAPMLEEAEDWLTEWPSIEAVIPSLSAVVRLEESVSEPVTLEPEEWRLVTTIGRGRPVGEVLAAGNLGEFEGCQALKKLADLRLVEVVPSPLERANGSTPATAQAVAGPPMVGDEWDEGEGVADLSEVWDDDQGTVGKEPEELEPEPAPEPVNRGLLLKFLGSARN